MLTNSWSASPVEVYVQRACDPSLHEPNYSLNLELAEYINQKKANTPREAAMAVARLVNHRNPHISVLALTLLQTLVQSCGYPFHLQISTKEFLNELVRRFPERPPPFPGPVMGRILDLIHSWREGICRESRFKEDFGNIRDMHRLLSFKGYRFRDNPRNANVAAQDTSVNLKSPDELESEDREAQSAKLQELIRRGTPRDLAAAQELMKIMAGADPDAKPDYRSKTLRELEKLQSHIILLNDMLDNVDPAQPERLVSGDAYDQVAAICRNSRPKLQKWISEAETDDPESLDTFLSINDLINNVLDRYERYQRGDYSAPPPPEPAAKSDLIDFDLDQGTSGSAPIPTAPADDLASLFGGGPSAPAPTPSSAPVPPGYSSTPLYGTSNGQPGWSAGSAFSPSTPSSPFGAGGAATGNGGSGLDGQGVMGGISLPMGSRAMSPMAPPSSASPLGGSSVGGTSGQQQAKKDPFADLAGLF